MPETGGQASGSWGVGCPGPVRKDTQRVDPDDRDSLGGAEQSRAWRRVVVTKERETQWVGEVASTKQQGTHEKCSQSTMKAN